MNCYQKLSTDEESYSINMLLIILKRRVNLGKQVSLSRCQENADDVRWFWIHCQKPSKNSCEIVNLYKFKYVMFPLPGFFLQLTQRFSKYIFNSFIKQGTPVPSFTSSAEPGSHNSKLTESFSTPTFLGIEGSYHNFGLC